MNKIIVINQETGNVIKVIKTLVKSVEGVVQVENCKIVTKNALYVVSDGNKYKTFTSEIDADFCYQKTVAFYEWRKFLETRQGSFNAKYLMDIGCNSQVVSFFGGDYTFCKKPIVEGVVLDTYGNDKEWLKTEVNTDPEKCAENLRKQILTCVFFDKIKPANYTKSGQYIYDGLHNPLSK